MAVATLVVGLGGTGALTTRYLKKLYLEMPAHERVPTRFLALDFDLSPLDEAAPEMADLSPGEFRYLSPSSIQDLALNIDRQNGDGLAWEKILEWYPDRQKVQITVGDVEANGASQFRPLGRLGFMGNDRTIENLLRSELDQLQAEVDTRYLTSDRRIIVLSSVCGGTGGGMLVDFAYVARRQEGRPKVYTYLLLPEVFSDVDTGSRIFQNAYAVLRELAHLKHQIVPFQAEYLNIPPIDVAAGGEEPISRVFLFGRATMVEGGSPIRNAAFQMAQTVLAQLHRQIQEKTLAVVSNAASASSAGDRDNMKTHAFSSAGSRYVDLSRVEVKAESLHREVLRVLSDPSAFEAVFSKNIANMLEVIQQKLIRSKGQSGKSQEAETNRTEGRGDEPPPLKPNAPDTTLEAEELATTWRWGIEKLSKDSARDLFEDLELRIQNLKFDLERADKNSLEKIEEVIGTLDQLKVLLLTEFKEEEFQKKLEVLKTLSRFPQIDGRLKDEIKLVVAQGVPKDAQGLFARLALISSLKRIVNRFWVNFPKPSSEALQAHAASWSKIQAKQEQFLTTPRNNLVDKEKNQRGVLAKFGFRKAEVLEVSLKDPELQLNVRAILLVRANKALKQMLAEQIEKLEAEKAKFLKPWKLLEEEDSSGLEEPSSIPPVIQELLERELREHLPELMETVHIERDNPSFDRRRLHELIRQKVMQNHHLRYARFLISEEGSADTDRKILEALVQTRQPLFVQRTPNTQRRGFAVILVPSGILWGKGTPDEFNAHIQSNAEQILDCKAQVIPSKGSRIWIYYENLFNPPGHIRSLAEYYSYYQRERFPEIFHIDRRFLSHPSFQLIHSLRATMAQGCGNSGCRHNILSLPRNIRICPGCHELIKSRCGNEDCGENALHLSPDAKAKKCPACGEFNHAAWWVCKKHGKNPVEIPIDKYRCPQCIQCHQDDRLGYPESEISVRPDLEDSEACPNCRRIAAKDPTHAVFYVRSDLLRFYRNGVNGHDHDLFQRLAERHGLPDGYRCPSCRTSLIPVNHRQFGRGETCNTFSGTAHPISS